MEEGRKTLFAKNTIIMTASSMAVKLLGLYLSMQLARSMKAEGMGLYSLVMSVYILASGLSVSGMSVAVTRISSQELAKGDEKTCRGTLRRCIYISLSLALTAALLMIGLSGVIAEHWLKDTRTVNSLCILAAALPFVSISAMLRGWYTARRKMLPPSLSQFFEQVVRLVSCLILVPKITTDASSGCLAVAICDLIAEFSGCALISIIYICSKKETSKAPENIGKRIFEHTLPITASHYLTSTLRTVESSLIPICLVAFGLSREEGLAKLGMIHSMAVPLMFFPSAMLTAAGTLLIPEIVRYNALGKNKKVKKTIESAVNLTIICAFPISAVFFLFGREWGVIVYNEPELSTILTVLAPLVPLMYCETICSSVLRGLGEQNSLLRYNAADGVLRLIFIILLVPRIGVAGVLVTMIISNIFTPVMCVLRLRKKANASEYAGAFLSSLVCIFAAGSITYFLKKTLSGIPDKVGAVLFSIIMVLIYFLFILGSTQKLKEAVRRVCLRIPKAVRYISCRRGSADAEAMRRAHHSR